MMNFNGGFGMGLMWIFWVLLIVGLVLLIILLVRLLVGGMESQGRRSPGRGEARNILAERLARGELTPDEYRERLRALDEGGT
ncbi:SHOCT domain-containing protein [Arthrobacter crystallopoietes]|uniref:SHOCT domain-containing protein n=1 Tax=Crystallibacter crystallopoietes TaxID=37928 RepID=UPI00111100F9|nr:SHOCT domain-containing protein [Arthrobacter crystallopoietes]